MKFQGRVFKDGNFWLAEIPLLELMTQAKTKKQLLPMVEDLFITYADVDGFEVNASCDSDGNLEVGSNDSKVMISLLLKRKRHLSGLSIQNVADLLGSNSKTSYARYEQGKVLPSIDKLQQLLSAIDSSSDLVISQAKLA